MKSYSDKLRDPRWQKKRLGVMERDGFKCRDCGDSKKTLHVHHCFYEKGGPWETPDNMLVTVCSECHEVREDLEKQTKRDLAVVFASGTQAQYLDIVVKIHGAWRRVVS